MPSDRHPPIAIIDIGTNSSKLIVGRVDDNGRPDVLYFSRASTRIGGTMSTDGRIGSGAVEETIDTLRRFLGVAARLRCAGVFAFSTFALRKAVNAEEVVREIETKTGTVVRPLSGREEARFAYISARRALRLRRTTTMVLDVGGGSTECVVARSHAILAARSVPIGALHLTESYVRTDPIATRDYAALTRRIDSVVRNLIQKLPPITPATLDLVVSGGSATAAGRMANAGADTSRVTLGELRTLSATCRRLSLEERKKLPGLGADRADIILAGIEILLAFVEATGKRVIRINTGGVREGVLIHVCRNNLRW